MARKARVYFSGALSYIFTRSLTRIKRKLKGWEIIRLRKFYIKPSRSAFFLKP
jgi:hypothetical protein